MSEYAPTFSIVDTDGDGLISAEELIRLSELLGRPLTAESAEAVIAKVDTDGDGLINLTEFGSWLDSAN